MGHFLRVASENKSGDDALVETGLTMLGTRASSRGNTATAVLSSAYACARLTTKGEYAAWFKSDPELLRAILQCICFYLALDTRPARAAGTRVSSPNLAPVRTSC
jgi:hypothetical protein